MIRPLPLILALALAGCTVAPRDETEAADLRAKLAAMEARLAQVEARSSGTNPAPTAAAAGHGEVHEILDPRQDPQRALDQLLAGNAALVDGKPQAPDLGANRIKELAGGQKPFAAVVGCADSRSSTEHLFGAGLGDVFVIRNAGAIVDDQSIASIEYAVAHLGTRLVVCLAHTRCGAIKATAAGAHDTPAVAGLVDHLHNAVADAKDEGFQGADLAERAAVRSAFRERDLLLARSELLRARHQAGTIKLAVAQHDLATGRVVWLDAGGLNAPPPPPGDRILAPPPAAPAARPEPVRAGPPPAVPAHPPGH